MLTVNIKSHLPITSVQMGKLLEHARRATTRPSIRFLQRFTPVDTGRASKGWYGRDIGVISNEVPYITFLDDGTRYMEAFRIVDKATPLIQQRLTEEVEIRIKRLS